MPRPEEEIPIFAIHFNLKDRSLEFEDEHGDVVKMTFPSSGTIYFTRPEKTTGEQTQPQEDVEQEAQKELERSVERKKTVTLSGRLKTKPKEGRRDRSNNPTAYARFAAHEEGTQGPHDYIATFHRNTVKIALSLNKEAQITVEGYPHLNDDPKRRDTFSVIRVLNYPGRRQRS